MDDERIAGDSEPDKSKNGMQERSLCAKVLEGAILQAVEFIERASQNGELLQAHSLVALAKGEVKELAEVTEGGFQGEGIGVGDSQGVGCQVDECPEELPEKELQTSEPCEEESREGFQEGESRAGLQCDELSFRALAARHLPAIMSWLAEELDGDLDALVSESGMDIDQWRSMLYAVDAVDASRIDDVRVVIEAPELSFYSERYMTSRYAHLLVLAATGDRVAALADCVRDESRTYPRPMRATSLCNPPFEFSPGEIGDLFAAAKMRPEYADLATVSASNGDVYYYSREHLSDRYAARLAERRSVDRWMNP